MLSEEQKMDLRKRVLMGQPLTLDEAREVFATLRTGAGVASELSKEKKVKKAGKTISDDQLDAELASLGL